MGTPAIAVPALQVLAARTEVTCVITQPDRPAGRGQHLAQSPVKVAAQELGIPLWQPESLKEHDQDPRLACDLAVVMAYGELLRQAVLDRPVHGCINLHASRLPRWRGASPLQAALRAGDPTTGVTVMRMVRALDAGAMFLTEDVVISPRMTLPELHDTMALSAARALTRFLDAFPGITPLDQDPAQVTTCHKLTADHGRLDFNVGANAVDRWVRAYTPAPGCWIPWSEAKLKILEVIPTTTPLPVGVVKRDYDRLFIGCGDDAIEVLRVQAPGKRAMSAADFMRGHELPEYL